MPNTLTVTQDTLTRDLILQARDRWPHLVSADRSADAQGLPMEYTTGGLPIYAPAPDIWHARAYIANVINTYGLEPASAKETL